MRKRERTEHEKHINSINQRTGVIPTSEQAGELEWKSRSVPLTQTDLVRTK